MFFRVKIYILYLKYNIMNKLKKIICKKKKRLEFIWSCIEEDELKIVFDVVWLFWWGSYIK